MADGWETVADGGGGGGHEAGCRLRQGRYGMVAGADGGADGMVAGAGRPEPW